MLTYCTIGNYWLKIKDIKRFELKLYDKSSGYCVRVFFDPAKLNPWPEFYDWFYKRKVKKKQNFERLMSDIRKAGDQVRINAQLIDATTGGHLWAERYDGHMADIFSLQDKITQKIVSALAVRLTSGEKENLASKGTDNLEAYDAFMRGWQHYLRHTPESFAQAISDFGKAVEIDPDFSRAYAALALVYMRASGSKEWYEVLETDYFTLRVKARHFLNIAMKKPTSLAYRVASSMDLSRRKHDKALQNAEKAIALNPADAESQYVMAEILVFGG